MTTTAEQARQVANQARLAATAYQAAFAATVPPPAIAANRAQLKSLVVANIFGQNTPAIAANQAQYAEMWVQNATTMYTYAGSSAAAATLAPFVEPTECANPAGQNNPVAAAGQATTFGAASQIPNLLHALASGNPLVDLLEQVNTFLETNPLYLAVSPAVETIGGSITAASSASFMTISPVFYLTPVIFSWFPPLAGGTSIPFTVSDISSTSTGSTLVSASSLAAGLGSGGSSPTQGAGRTVAELGRAATVGGLSTPQAWGSAPGIQLASMTSPLASGSVGVTGFHGGMPPIASVVNAPRANTSSGVRGGVRRRSMAQFDRASDSGEIGGEPVPDIVNPLTDKEREELTGLRAQLAKLVMEQDAMTRLMNRAFQS